MSRRTKALILAPVALAFAPAVWRLVEIGNVDTYAGHVTFVPLFSALAAWVDRHRLRASAGPGHGTGALVILAGLAALAAGYVTANPMLYSLALATGVAGTVVWLFGGRCLRAAMFPVGFLVMMTPLPRPVVAAVTLQLQLFAAGFAAAVLRLLDFPVYRVGVMLEVPGAVLKVAEICNGLRFLLALLVMTAAFAQVLLPTVPRKVVLVAAAVPVAIVANATRVAVIAVGVHYIGLDAATGTTHHWIGKAVWVMTLLPLAGLAFWLARWRRHGGAAPSAGLVRIRPRETEVG